MSVEAVLALAAPPERLVLGFDGGNACARRPVRCKAKGGAVDCR